MPKPGLRKARATRSCWRSLTPCRPQQTTTARRANWRRSVSRRFLPSRGARGIRGGLRQLADLSLGLSETSARKQEASGTQEASCLRPSSRLLHTGGLRQTRGKRRQRLEKQKGTSSYQCISKFEPIDQTPKVLAQAQGGPPGCMQEANSLFAHPFDKPPC